MGPFLTSPGRRGAWLSPGSRATLTPPSSPLSPVPPEATVFPRRRVELGEPNILICYVDKFWPSVISITWLKNGQEVRDGVLESIFYPRDDHSFRKFSYLPFIPTRGDYYDCRVEHEGLPTALLKHW
ncbi:HLA class II histocompatibility antigen, DR alpha chain-like, partial [Egretta garzetta]|uniref:HLA class II histocompatibility antigen, DR alpha chain-like n=1 Tax=Egretta garzetta TaxID=188379 RepID=UPI00163BAD4A